MIFSTEGLQLSSPACDAIMMNADPPVSFSPLMYGDLRHVDHCTEAMLK